MAASSTTTRGQRLSQGRFVPARLRERSVPAGVVIVLVLAVLVGAWALTTGLGWVDPLVASTPQDVARAIPDILGGEHGQAALKTTGYEILLAFAIGTGAGLVVGTVLGVSDLLRRAYLPFITFLLSTPKAVFLPIFLLVLGITTTSAAAFGAFEAFFYVTVNVVGGIDLVEPRHLLLARAFRASRMRTFTDVIFPSALPGISSALWYGVKHAFLGVMISELWASQGGVGMLLKVYADQLDSAHVLAIVLIISAAAILAGTLWSRVEAWLSRWRATQAGVDAVTVRI